MQRIWLVPALGLAACSFEGSSGSPPPDAGMEVGDTAVPVPQPFPWRISEPNDASPPEDGTEQYVEMKMDSQQPAFYGTFDDVDAMRMSRVLCECTVSP